MIRRSRAVVASALVAALVVPGLGARATPGAPGPAAPPAAANAGCHGCPPPRACDGCWQPPLQARWQIQLQGVPAYCSTGGIDASVSAVPFTGGPPVSPTVYAFDTFVDDGACPSYAPGTPNVDAVNAVHAAGARAIAYVDAGTWEQWRADQHRFVRFDRHCGGCLLGNALSHYADERYFNITNRRGQRHFLLKMMAHRVRAAANAGFDGVYFDNQDEFQSPTGFHITAHEQIMYLTRLLNLAHRFGLSAGPNNDILQDPKFEPYANFQINEQCFQYHECRFLSPMVDAGKPVFQIEYSTNVGAYCPKANSPTRNLNSIRKKPDLFDLPWEPCR